MKTSFCIFASVARCLPVRKNGTHYTLLCLFVYSAGIHRRDQVNTDKHTVSMSACHIKSGVYNKHYLISLLLLYAVN